MADTRPSRAVAIPLYLTARVSRTSDETLPTTRVLRLFVAEHQQARDKAEALRKELFGLHSQTPTALAVEATRTTSTTISESPARAIINRPKIGFPLTAR